MDAERYQRARDLLRNFPVGDGWSEVFDPAVPDWMRERQLETLEAYGRGDLDWLIERTDPEVEIVQPPEFPDSRTYRGHEGLVDAFLDWPNEWEDFRIEPKRAFAVGEDRLVVDAIHSGRSLRMGIEVEVEIFWLLAYQDRLLRRWDMFLTLEQTLGAAGA